MTKPHATPSKNRWISFTIFVALIVFVQLIGNLTTLPEIPTWYASLKHPAWTPPNWLFGPVWTALYIMIAIAGWLLWQTVPGSPQEKLRRPVLRFYFLQLLLNFLWSPLFFKYHLVEIALADIAALVVCIAFTIKHALSYDRRAAYLLVPYLMWVAYASTLNAGIAYLN